MSAVTRRRSLQALTATAAFQLQRAAAAPLSGIRLVVLDVGGTIIEDRGDVVETLRVALERHGVTVTPAEISPWRGASKREVVRHFVEERTKTKETARAALIDEIYKDFSRRLIEIYKSVPPIAGAEDAIRRLRAAGFLVATTTGFDRAITASIFERLGWEKYFAAAVSSDEVAQGRPSPYMIFHAMEAARVASVAEVVAVGDTPLDLQAGTNAGAKGVVGVLTGAGSAKQLSQEPHTHIVQSVADVPALLSSHAAMK